MIVHKQTAPENHLSRLALIAGGAIVTGLTARSLLRFHRRMDFAGKTVLVTGGSRGLGIAIARRFVQARANVAILARNPEHLQQAQTDLIARGGNVLALQCELSSQEQVESAIARVIAHFGSLDVLINNAGTIQVSPESQNTLGDYQEAMNTHFWGPLHTIHAALPQMRKQGSGRIVNIASIGGKIAVPHLVPYSASKFALVGLSHGLRAELARENIFVTTVCPGLMRTGSPRNAKFKSQNEKEFAWFATSDGMPLLSISPDRMAQHIYNAARHGVAEAVLPLIFSLQAKACGLFPGLFLELSSLVNRFLPGPGGIGPRSAFGYQSDTLQPNFTRKINEAAAAKYNQLAPGN